MPKGVPNKRYTAEFKKMVVETMLDEAFAEIPDGTGLILHSDQGWQYRHKQHQRMLEKKAFSRA